MSAHADTDTALNAIELGVIDYIAKPFQMQEMSFRVQKALTERRMYARLSAYGGGATEDLEGMVGRSAVMRALFQMIERIAPTQSTVLIQGQSGTGKELIARAVHALSDRARKPFVALNCAAIPETLLESELFGHVRGAFTGAEDDRRGLFEEAEGGTIFLDEVGELPLSLQVKLLRVLQEREVKPLGANKSRAVDVRVIAATLKDLEQEVSLGLFRGDLYYRLNVIPITAPLLRERPDDIPLLAERFIKEASARFGIPKPNLTPAALQALLACPWPGNVRELSNAIEHAVVLSDGDLIHSEDLPISVTQRQTPTYEQVSLSDDELCLSLNDLSIKRQTLLLESVLIKRALEVTDGVKSQAAALLEISSKTLLYKIKSYNISLD
jgi:two-component system, NtrC family, response regulator AtoC